MQGRLVGIMLSDGAALACSATAIGDLTEQASLAGPLDGVAIDMPIGLPDSGRRQADVLARQLAAPPPRRFPRRPDRRA
jgi:predicted RNase H-like nuclease